MSCDFVAIPSYSTSKLKSISSIESGVGEVVAQFPYTTQLTTHTLLPTAQLSYLNNVLLLMKISIIDTYSV